MAQVFLSGGQIVGKAESNAPIPHAITNLVKKTGNYGLANRARADYPLLLAPPTPDLLATPALAEKQVKDIRINGFNFSKHLAAVQRRYNSDGLENNHKPYSAAEALEAKLRFEAEVKSLKSLLPDPFETVRKNKMTLFELPISVGFDDYQDESEDTKFAQLYGEFKESKKKQVPTTSSPSVVSSLIVNDPNVVQPKGSLTSVDSVRTSTVVTNLEENHSSGVTKAPVASGKGQGTKANGYVLFLNYKKRQNAAHANSTVNALIETFDNAWKSLSEEQRNNWRLRAKELNSNKNNNKSSPGKRDTSVDQRPRRNLPSPSPVIASSEVTNGDVYDDW